MNRCLLIMLFLAIAVAPSAAQKNRDKKDKENDNPITVKIRLTSDKVKKLRDLKVVMIITNKGRKSEKFLFERVDATTSAPLFTYCNIYNSKNKPVVKYNNRIILDTLSKVKRRYDDTYYTMEPTEWIMKEYNVGELVMLDSTICKKYQLPKDKYTMQIQFHGAQSNTVSFTVD
ncbi:MAG: hypothetical protein P4L41_18840 [Flavipsychrobacter sp.]|nr:hypothetical protein [Flavipsychrobacter sp.]